MGVSGCVEVRAGVAVEVGDWMGATAAAVAATGVGVGVGSGTTRAALAGAVGVGRGVSVGAGAGASVESSPQATASTIIAVNARATVLTCASPFSLGAGRPPYPRLLSHSSDVSLATQSTTILYSNLPPESSQIGTPWPTRLDEIKNFHVG